MNHRFVRTIVDPAEELTRRKRLNMLLMKKAVADFQAAKHIESATADNAIQQVKGDGSTFVGSTEQEEDGP